MGGFCFLQSYGPAKSLTHERILELGCLVTEMSERELQDANLADLGIVTHLGAWRGWTPKKVQRHFCCIVVHHSTQYIDLYVTLLAIFASGEGSHDEFSTP